MVGGGVKLDVCFRQVSLEGWHPVVFYLGVLQKDIQKHLVRQGNGTLSVVCLCRTCSDAEIQR
jgi:hypothetical protein